MQCPECGSSNIATERRPDGDSTCKVCGHSDKTAMFVEAELLAENGFGKNKVKNPEANSRYGLWGDFESIDVIKQLLTPEEYEGFLKGNILKYRLRDKGCDEQDHIKARDYKRELDELLREK